MDPQTSAAPAEQTPPANSPAPAAPPAAAPPPASQTVLDGELTERELKLQAELAAERAKREQAEASATTKAAEADALRGQLNQPKPRRVRRFMGFEQELD